MSLQPRDVLGHLPPQLALDDVVLVQQRRQPGQLVLAQLAGLSLRIDARLVAQLAGDLRAHAVQVRSARTIVGRSRDVDTQQTRHGEPSDARPVN